MRKFLNGEREFKKGEIIYFVDNINKLINYGTIDTYAGHGLWYIDLYTIPNMGTIDGILLKDIDCNKKYPLPKKWTYDTKLFEVKHPKAEEEIINKLKTLDLKK